MAYNNLQGNSAYLQGGSGYLQGSVPDLQGSSPQLQNTFPQTQNVPKPKPKTAVYGTPGATTSSSAKRAYTDSLGSYKYADDPTVYGNYNGNPNYAFTSEQEFKNAGGDFGRVETRQRPNAGMTYGFMDGNSYGVTGQPVQTMPQATQAQTTVQQPLSNGSTTDALSGYKDAYAKYLAALAPDTELGNARKKYVDFLSAQDRGVDQIRNKPIAERYVTGQQAGLLRQNQATEANLQREIGMLTSDQEQRQKMLSGAVEFEKSLFDMNKPATPTEVSAGNTLVDPRTGKVIYQAPERQGSIDYPSSYKEYLLTTNNPTPEGFNEWLTYDANRKRSITNVGGGSGTDKPLPASDAKVRDYILQNKRENPNVPYYDLWGQLADELRKDGLNPDNYDQIFWELLHPEGEAGYKKYKANQSSGREL